MSWRLPRCGAPGASPCSPAGSVGAEPRSRCPDVRVSLVAALASLLGVVTPVAVPASLVLGALSLLAAAGPTLAQTTEERVIFQQTLTAGIANTDNTGWVSFNAAPSSSPDLLTSDVGSLPSRGFHYLGTGYAIEQLIINNGTGQIELAFNGLGRPVTRLKSEGILYIGTHKLKFSDSVNTSFSGRKATLSGVQWDKPSGATSWPSFSTGSTYTIKVAVPVPKNPVPTKVTLKLQEKNGQQVAVAGFSSYQQEEKYRDYYLPRYQLKRSTDAWPARANESSIPTGIAGAGLPPLEDGKIERIEFSNLAAGTTYQFRAHLIEKFANTDRVVPASSQVQEVTIAPAAPTGLGVAAGNEELRLTWTAPTGATDYDVHYTSADAATVANDAAASGNDESAAWVDAVSTGATSATQGRPRATILLLTNNVAYRVRVRAKNSGGNSAWASGTGTPKSNDATLSALTATSSTSAAGSFASLNIGTFASGTTSYTASVENTVTHVKLRPTVNESNATVKVGKGSSLTAVTSGSPSGAIALAVGANALKVEVTAADGTTKKTYTVTVTRAKSNDATLSALTATGSTSATGSFTSLSIGTFASGTTSYAATVESTVTHVKLRPTVNDSNAKVKVGKQGATLTAVTSGNASGAIALNSQGSTAITVEVTAEDGVTKKTYTVTMDRFSHQLSGLRVAVPGRGYRDPSGPTYSQPEVRVPNFRRDTFGYNIEVPYDATELIVTAKWPGSNAIVSITSNGGGTIITRKKNFRTKDGTETVGLAASGQTTIVIKVDNSGSDACSETTCSDYTLRVTKTAVAKASIATTSAWGGEVWEGEGTIRVTATLSYALHHDVRVPLNINCGGASWCDNKSIYVGRGRGSGTLDLKPPRDEGSTNDLSVDIELAAANEFPAGIARATAQKDYKNTIAVRNLDFEVNLTAAKTELAEGEETTVTLDLGRFATRGTDEVRFLVTVEGMGTGDNPAKPSRSVTNPGDYGGDFSLWAEGTTKILEKGKQVTYEQSLTGTPITIFVDTKTYPGRARPRVSNGKLMLAVPFNKGNKTKALKLNIGKDAVVELDETFKLKVAVQFGNGNEKTAELDFTITDNDRSVDGDAKVYVLDPVKEWGQNYASCLAVVRLVSNARGGVRLEQAVTIPVSVNGQKRSLTIGAGKTANWIENANKDVTVEVLRDELPEDGLVSRDDPATALTEGLRVAYYSLDGQNVIVYNPYEEHDVTRRYAYEKGCVASPTVPENEEGKRKYGPSSGTDGETLLVGFGQIAQTLPEVSIERVGSSTITEGQMASFRLTATPAPAAPITVAVAIGDRGEFVSSDQPNPRMVTIGEAGTADFSVATQDDDMDEPDGAITATVTAGTGYTVSDNTAKAEVTVRDDDAPVAAPPTEEKRAWHVRFGRTVSQQVVDALQQRFSTTTTPSGLQLTVAGENLTSDTPLQENHVLLSRLLGFERVSSQELAQGSSFSFSPDGAGARLSFWGQGAFSSFNGIEESITLTGDVTTALLGAEWNTQRWQAGAALSHSWGNGSYQGEGDAADGRISSSLTGVFPYGRYALTPRLGVWATAGYGWGNITLNPDGDGSEYNPATTMALGAVGMDGLLLDGGREGLTLTTTADALFLKTSSEAVEGLEFSEGNITRLRLGLEASRAFPLSNGAALSPSLEVGLRQDSGDAETGFGMDLGAGLSWNDPEQGITATVKGRTLVSHGAEDFQDQGLALSFSWQPTPSNRGASLSLSHAVGLPAEGGMAALLNPTAIEVLDEPHSSGERFEARLAYGFPFYNDRLTLTPAVAAALSPSSRTYGLLWSLAPYDEHLHAEPWELSLEGERQENLSSSSIVDHSLKLRFALPL